jgi:methyl-accepting chemotaxis protein
MRNLNPFSFRKHLLIKHKIVLLISLFGFCLTAVFSGYTYFNQKSSLLKSVDEKLYTGAYLVNFLYGEKYHDGITGSKSVTEAEDLANVHILTEVAQKIGAKYLYSMIMIDDSIHFTTSSATENELKDKSFSRFYDQYPSASPKMIASFSNLKSFYEEYTDKWGTFRSIIVPYKTANGKVFVIGADIPIEEINAKLLVTLFTSFGIGVVLFSAFLILVFISIKKITNPINILAESAKQIAAGNLSTQWKVESNDETKDLSDSLTQMMDSIKESHAQLEDEKKGVEKKVESAVKEIEEKENYLKVSVEKIMSQMEKFAAGDLTVELKVNSDDHIGKLFASFNQTVSNIGNLINMITEAVYATTSSSNQISASTEEMAAGAKEQSDQTSEIAGSIEEMAKTIIETTKNASLATEASKNAGHIAQEGGSVVRETIEGMIRITEVVKQTSVKVTELGKSSNQIGEIVEVIDEIAEQTNLLALNAAIEAARAGDQGRGFAVVADEVRKLADKTSKATKEISQRIKQIQKDTSSAIDSMNKGITEVEKGKILADKAENSLKEIINGSEKVVNIVTLVAAASEMQSTSSEQIAKNIESINNVTIESTTGLHQIAEAAEDLNRLTQNLQELVGSFKVSQQIKKPMLIKTIAR